MMSDNATTYISAADDLTELFSEETRALLGQEGLTWKFILKNAPWILGEVDWAGENGH